MEALRSWAVGLCVTAVAATVIQLLIPKKGVGSVLRVLLTAFFLCVFTAPLLSWRGIEMPDLSDLPDTVQDDLLDEAVTRQLEAQVSMAVEEIVQSVLSSRGYTATQIKTNTDIAEDGGIYITDVEVTLPADAAGAVSLGGLLETRLGVPVTVRKEETG